MSEIGIQDAGACSITAAKPGQFTVTTGLKFGITPTAQLHVRGEASQVEAIINRDLPGWKYVPSRLNIQSDPAKFREYGVPVDAATPTIEELRRKYFPEEFETC